MNLNERTSGILLHLSSLPGPHCCGDLGKIARRFADFLAQAGQKWWQMLPINPIDECFSPYSSISAFAGDPLYIDLDDLCEQGLLDPEDIAWGPVGPKNHTAYHVARDYRSVRWDKAFRRFQANRGGEKYRVAYAGTAYDGATYEGAVYDGTVYERFAAENSWARPYALFCALAEKYGTQDWVLWPDEAVRHAQPEALRAVAGELAERIEYHLFLQLVFDVQWQELRRYCNDRGIGLIGDVPIYVSRQSVETWSETRLFQIDSHGHLERVAGVPGDSFNPEGQRWNSPLYRWDVHRDDGYAWWTARLVNTLKHFDAVRLDHFIGFYNYFSMPPENMPKEEREAKLQDPHLTPEEKAKLLGEWIIVPQDALFEKIRRVLPDSQFIAEDLGVLKEGVIELRNKFGFPGMNVFQFGFDFFRGDDPTIHWEPNSVVCTGTHDTPPLSAWLEELLLDHQLDNRRWNWDAILSMLKSFIGGTEEWKNRFGHEPLPDGRSRDWPGEAPSFDKKTLIRAMIEMTMHSPGNTAVFPMQDIIAAGPESRMNFPGHAENNWCWRLDEADLTDDLANTLAYLTWLYRRK